MLFLQLTIGTYKTKKKNKFELFFYECQIGWTALQSLRRNLRLLCSFHLMKADVSLWWTFITLWRFRLPPFIVHQQSLMQMEEHKSFYEFRYLNVHVKLNHVNRAASQKICFYWNSSLKIVFLLNTFLETKSDYAIYTMHVVWNHNTSRLLKLK